MIRIFGIIALLFLSCCATDKIQQTQSENCFQYTFFPQFQRCSEQVVKGSYDYRFGFEKDIIDQYFAYGEVLALQVERKTLDNIEAFKQWGDELDAATSKAQLREGKALELTIVTAALAVTAYSLYKQNLKIKDTNRTQLTTSSSVNRLTPTSSSITNYTPNSGVAACKVGLLINRIQGITNNLMRTWC